MKNNISTAEQLIPPRARRRAEREMINGLSNLNRDFSCRFLPRNGAFLFLIPHGKGTRDFTSTSFDLAAAEKLAEFFLSTIPDAEELPFFRSTFDHLDRRHKREVEGLNCELQVLRWRIMHLEREALERVPRYSDRTALAVRGGAS